jgi:hypothetical protein
MKTTRRHGDGATRRCEAKAHSMFRESRVVTLNIPVSPRLRVSASSSSSFIFYRWVVPTSD